MSKRVLAIVLLLMTMAVPSAPVVEAHGDDADVIIEWNGLLQSTLPSTAGLQVFRFYAMLHVAMFDAVNSIEERYEPYRVEVRASHGASAEAAAAQAGHDILAFLIPGGVATYDAALAARLATISPGRRGQGVRIGKKVAEQIIALRQNDGWSLPPPPVRSSGVPGTLAADASRVCCGRLHATAGYTPLRSSDEHSIPAREPADANEREVCQGLQ